MFLTEHKIRMRWAPSPPCRSRCWCPVSCCRLCRWSRPCAKSGTVPKTTRQSTFRLRLNDFDFNDRSLCSLSVLWLFHLQLFRKIDSLLTFWTNVATAPLWFCVSWSCFVKSVNSIKLLILLHLVCPLFEFLVSPPPPPFFNHRTRENHWHLPDAGLAGVTPGLAAPPPPAPFSVERTPAPPPKPYPRGPKLLLNYKRLCNNCKPSPRTPAHPPVASSTINISVIFREVSGLEQFLTAAAVKTKFVKNLPLRLDFLGKVNCLGASGALSGHPDSWILLLSCFGKERNGTKLSGSNTLIIFIFIACWHS